MNAETGVASPPAILTGRSAIALQRLRDGIAAAGPMVIGYSGGADSTLLVKAAYDVLGGRALAVTAVSPSLAKSDLEEAASIAAAIGVTHRLVESHEMEEEGYLENSPRRCFFCKAELFRILKDEASRAGFGAVAYGAITDDLGDFRPGMDAAREAGAVAPLLDAGIGKEEVREISRHLGLPTWNKPASACLSSRVPFGVRVDPAILARIEAAEDALRREGMTQVRVRDHGEVARVECLPSEFDRLMEPDRRRRVVDALRAAGYRHVALDLLGYRSGSLNPSVRP
jgi:pyridinium-3,5-biscarboxylic acid mononucleotide sulfurtransferase